MHRRIRTYLLSLKLYCTCTAAQWDISVLRLAASTLARLGINRSRAKTCKTKQKKTTKCEMPSCFQRFVLLLEYLYNNFFTNKTTGIGIGTRGK